MNGLLQHYGVAKVAARQLSEIRYSNLHTVKYALYIIKRYIAGNIDPKSDFNPAVHILETSYSISETLQNIYEAKMLYTTRHCQEIVELAGEIIDLMSECTSSPPI
jgi:HEPN domain-containing protein